MEEVITDTCDINIEFDGVHCQVVPKQAKVKSLGTVTFHNLTDMDLGIMFSDDELFATDTTKVGVGQSKPMDIKVDVDEPVTYRYAVYCKRTDDFAKAGSMPIIIIVRK